MPLYYEADDTRPGRQARLLRRADSLPVRFDEPVLRQPDIYNIPRAELQDNGILRRRRRVNQPPAREPMQSRYQPRVAEVDDANPVYFVERALERSPTRENVVYERPVRGRSPTRIASSNRPQLVQESTAESDLYSDTPIRLKDFSNNRPDDVPYARTYEQTYDYPAGPSGRNYDEDERTDARERRRPRRLIFLNAKKKQFDAANNTPQYGPMPISAVTYNDFEDEYPEIRTSRRTAPIVIQNRVAAEPDGEEDSAPLIIEDYGLGLNPDIIPQAYSFSLSGQSNSLGFQTPLGSASDISDKEELLESNQDKGNNSGVTQNIVRSQYVGDGVIGGRHNVELTTLPDPGPGATKGQAPVFRWM